MIGLLLIKQVSVSIQNIRGKDFLTKYLQAYTRITTYLERDIGCGTKSINGTI